MPAPTGVSAQKSEGFQRFYKAVVSPTHVRVTAGGRIVPNTRGPASPTSKRSKDSSGADPQASMERKPSLVSIPSPIPMMTPYIPGYPGYPPIPSPLSFMPMAFGPTVSQVTPFSQPPAGASVPPQQAADNPLKDTHNTRVGEKRPEIAPIADKDDKVKITPPEFFDTGKPFFYNGQLMYPVPTGPLPGVAPAPMGAAPNLVPFQFIGLPPGMMPGHVVQAGQNGAGQMMNSAHYQPAMMGAHGYPALMQQNLPVSTSFRPPPAPQSCSTIKRSEITAKQIANLKGQLKYFEDQLQYNRHQIDEKVTEGRCRDLQAQISHFENMQKMYSQQESPQANKDHKADTPEPPAADAEREANNMNSRMAALHESSSQQPQALVGKSDGSQGFREARSRSRHTQEARRETSSDMAFEAAGTIGKGSGLSSAAALAPVFQPRGYASSWEGGESVQDPQSETDAKFNQRGRVWKGPEPAQESQPHGSRPLGPAASIETTGQTNSYRSSKKDRGDSYFGVPYLLGTLPKGVNSRQAKDQDYVYSRPLTDDELRARYLYWGQAPRSIMQGLPKFDGKHFYPASPDKKPGESQPGSQPRRIPVSRPETEYDFRLTQSESDPFRPMTPVQKAELHKPVTASEDGYAGVRHLYPHRTQELSSSGDFANSTVESSPYSSPVPPPRSHWTQEFSSGDFPPSTTGAGSSMLAEAGSNMSAVAESRETSGDATSISSSERRSDRSRWGSQSDYGYICICCVFCANSP